MAFAKVFVASRLMPSSSSIMAGDAKARMNGYFFGQSKEASLSLIPKYHT